MKDILIKFHINFLTYYFLLICFICGYIKNVLIIFLIVIIHELGHVFFIKLFKYKIISIDIYPFGGITKIEKLINSSVIKDIVISLGGVLFQIIFIYLIIRINYFNELTISLFNSYNKVLIIFNLLPIIPLDGSKFLESILNYYFSYKKSYYITLVISIISIILFINYNYIYSFNNYLICLLLIYYSYMYLKNYKYNFNKFLLERIMYDLPYKKIINNTKNINELKKERYHYFSEGNKYKSEKAKIKEIFDKNRLF